MKVRTTIPKLCILNALLLLSFHAIAFNQINYTINGKIKGLPDRTRIFLLKINAESNPDTIGTTLSEGGTFHLKGSDAVEGKFHAIAFDQTDKIIQKVTPNGQEPVGFIIENQDISISGSIETWPKVKFSNSKTNENYYKLIDEIRAINKYISERFPQGGDGMDSIYMTALKQAFLKYPDSNGTSAILERYTLLLSSNDILSIYNTFTPRVKNSYYGKILNQTLRYLTDPHSITEGKSIPDFKLAVENGDSVSIIEYAASKEYVLIDIWASWCIPCREEIPNLKEVYKKYSEKGLGIISLSIDKGKTAWESALKKEEMPWTQSWDPKELVAGKVFRVSSIPVYILVNKQGKLVAFHAGSGGIEPFGPKLRGTDLKNTLAELFGY